MNNFGKGAVDIKPQNIRVSLTRKEVTLTHVSLEETRIYSFCRISVKPHIGNSK